MTPAAFTLQLARDLLVAHAAAVFEARRELDRHGPEDIYYGSTDAFPTRREPSRQKRDYDALLDAAYSVAADFVSMHRDDISRALAEPTS